jgi:anti-sigma B factor antagonist
MNNLEINQETRGDEIVLLCTGRLDANNAGHLNDYINRIVREGSYHILLDLSGIEYLSSAGIRSLVGQYKNLKAVNGHFCILAMSDSVRQVLNMVGMADMLSQPLLSKKNADKKEIQVADSLKDHGFLFKIIALKPEAKTALGVYGKPALTHQAGFTEKDARNIQAEPTHFALGLGAIGDSFGECKERFGEFVMLGKNVAYLPADGSKKPDYMVSTGQLIPTLTELYGLHFEGNFSSVIRFDTLGEQPSVGLSQIAESAGKLAQFNQWAFVMLAESGGLIGASLNSSPVEGRKIFSFPEIKETVNFTTEPAHDKMLTLSVGIISNEKDGKATPFLRPLKQGTNLSGHVHSVVFPYIPLKKTEIDLSETIDYLFNSSELVDILHLANDNRENVGLGESQFVQGFCWVAPIETINDFSK